MSYSRRDEEEADREGMRMVLTAGNDPRGMIRMFEAIEEHDKAPDMPGDFSTHPRTDQRVLALGSLASSSEAPEGATPSFPEMKPGSSSGRAARSNRELPGSGHDTRQPLR